MKFEKGECYFAIPCLEGARKTLVTMIGRQGRNILFASTQPVETTWVDEFDGREVARLKDADGCEFTVSPASHVDAVLAHSVAEAMRIPTAIIHRPPAKLPKNARRGIFSRWGMPIC